MKKRLAGMLAVAMGVKLMLDAAGDAFVRMAFRYVPAQVGAWYWGVPLDGTDLSFTAHGVTLEITRACAATDFFSMALALLLFSRYRWYSLPLAWGVTLAANAVRIILLIPVDRAFPAAVVPAVHLGAGIAVFLPTLLFIWHIVNKKKEVSHDRQNGN